jgi:hypothetical protein
MQPWGKVSSIPDANTVFEGQQINGQTQIRETPRQIGETPNTDKRDTEERHRREIKERTYT